MEGKTKVLIKEDTHQCRLKKGDQGYIDGYVTAADNIPYAVVVCGFIIDYIPIYALSVIQA